MDFGALFSRAARITWEHKILWLFGFIVSIFGGGYSANRTLGNLRGFTASRQDIPIDPVTGLPDFNRVFPYLPPGIDLDRLVRGDLQGLIAAAGAFFLVGACIALILALVFALIQWLGRGALIGLVNDVEDGAASVSGARGFSVGGNHFLRLFIIGLLLGLPTILLILVGVLVFGAGMFNFVAEVTNQGTGEFNPFGLFGALGCLLPLVCISVGLGWFLGLLRNLAVRAAVIENRGVFDSIGRGWRLLIDNIGSVLIIWILLAILGVVFGFIVGLPGIAIGLPMFYGLSAGEGSGSLVSLSLVLACGYGILIAGLSAILVAFVSATWTLAYRQFVGQEAVPLQSDLVAGGSPS